MAQTIKIRRGGIGAIKTSTPTTLKGELILATGSFSGGVLGTSLFAAEADNTLRLTHGRIDSVSDGSALATEIGNNDSFTGLLIHSASDNKLYRYNGTAFVELPVAAGSFDGILGVTSGGTGLGEIADNSVLVSTAADTLSAVSLATDGALLVGGTTTGPAAVTPATLGGNGITATGGNGTLVLSVDNLNNTITVAAGGISVNTGSISAGGTDLVNADVINTLSASIATDITANAGSVSGADTQVAFFDGASSVIGDAGMTYNSSTDVLTVGGSTFGANVIITGDLTVNGTTTQINTQNLNVEDNIIVVNYGGSQTDAGIYAVDNVSTTGTGSLLWDGTSDWWKAGVKDSEKRVVTFNDNSGGTDTAIQRLNGNSDLVDSSLTDDGDDVSIDANVALTSGHTFTALNAVTFSGLTGATNNTSAQVAFVGSDGKLGEVATAVDSSATATGFLAYSSDNVLEFVSTIDGGTF